MTCYWVCDDEALINAISEQPIDTDQIKVGGVLSFEDWQRYSLKHQEFLPLGGIVGLLELQGDVNDLLFWLRIGQPLPLGGKTTFSPGSYPLCYPSLNL